MKATYNWSRAERTNTTSKIVWLDSAGKEVSPSKIAGFGLPNEDWHTVEITVVAPANAAQAQIRFEADWPEFSAGTYWRMDSITFAQK